MNTRCKAAWLRFAGLASLGCAFAGVADAQYTGPGAQKSASAGPALTVADVLADAKDDRPVELTGNLLKQTGRELYRFRDASGEITVEIDDEDFPAGKPVDASVQVKIRGEVDARTMREPRVEVERLEVVAAAP